MTHDEIHISSLVVHVRPDRLQSVKSKIACLPGTEIHGESDNGKLVVVLETQNQGFITDIIETISKLDDVLNTALVYHQIEYADSPRNDRI